MPFQLDTEGGQPRLVLFNRTQIVLLRIPETEVALAHDLSYSIARSEPASLLISSGDRMTGEIHVVGISGHARLSDFTNLRAFIYFEKPDQTVIVSLDHVIELVPLNGAPGRPVANAIDALLDRLDDPAGRLLLEVGRAPRIVVGGTETDVQPTAMTQQDVVGLAMLAIPASVRAKLRTDSVITFAYVSEGGRAYDVEIRRAGPALTVSLAYTAGAPTADQTPLAEPPPSAVAAVSDPTPAAGFASPSDPAAGTAAPAAAGPGYAIDALFRMMCAAGASDLHLSVSAPPLLRVDGRMTPLDPDAASLTPTAIERLVVEMMPPANKAEFERRRDTDFSYEIARLARFRANVFMDRKGLGAVFRAIPAKILTAEQLELSLQILQLCHLSKGLVVVTGPTGSGKSTTLCAMIDYINKNRDDHIITIEDPIEFVHENLRYLIDQREVGGHTDSFRDAPGGPSRRPRHHSRRRDARPRDDRHRHRDGRDGSPRFRDAAYDHGRVDGRPDHRSVPAEPAGADPRDVVGVAPWRHRPDPVPKARRRTGGGARGPDYESGRQ